MTEASSPYSRRLAFTERMYLAGLHQDGSGLTVQFAFHGHGHLNQALVEQAVARAAKVHPGSRLVLKGYLGFSRWVANAQSPPVREIAFRLDETLPVSEQRFLDPRQGPTLEVLWAQGEGSRIVFRCLHSVMDGAGLFLFAEDVFAAFRGDQPKGVNNEWSDSEFLIDTVGKRFRANMPWNSPPVFERPDLSSSSNKSIRTRHISQKPITNLVAKISVSLTKKLGHGKTLRFMIPTDVRNYRREIRSTANLSYPLFYEVHGETTIPDLQKTIFRTLVNKDLLRLDPLELKGRWIPLFLLRWILQLLYRLQRRSGKSLWSFFISHIQFPLPKIFIAPVFETQSIEYIPAREFKFGALSIASTTFGNVQDVVVFAPENWASREDLQMIADCIQEVLSAE
ncbi:MAG: hypothetical protein EOP10_07405 [Proteobacteria bacterium]|nr:MAG: hypothetical protein EOP10_07405 [Pseudomonadota bacterium]